MSKKVVIFKPNGRLDAESYAQIRTEAMAIANTNPDILVVDLENIAFVDSRGLGLLITLLKLMRSREGQLVLCSVRQEVQALLELTNTDRLFEISEHYPSNLN
ncbi:STAS domain-containing protein [Synechococcus sp. PCC 7502]|uniref:STAS domain-containing protein n=1 Tax=Synechococcus sp. PCC 7502 TaxID=1173263 RepID=UPI00059DB198|nr:STAS domain-containing protein [Synechococcus sp. PCC 7502]